MSLDVYLTTPGVKHGRQSSGIFVRRNGQTQEISREEWDRLYPDREPVTCTVTEDETEEVFSANITHNLNRMADEAGIYKHLWMPDEIGVTKAAQLIEPLAEGLAKMKADPERFERSNPPNGWGSYDDFVPWIERYLEACPAVSKRRRASVAVK